MPMYNSIEHNYSKTTGSLWQCYRDEPVLNDNGVIIDFPADDTPLFKFKQKITGQTGNDGTKDGQIIALSKYSINFWKTLEMSVINCEINVFYFGLKNVL